MVAGLRECEHVLPTKPGNLNGNVRSSAEAVKSHALSAPCHLQSAIADKACAQQRGGLGVAVCIGKLEAVSRICDRVFRISAIDLIAGKARTIAEVLTTALAVVAGAACPS